MKTVRKWNPRKVSELKQRALKCKQMFTFNVKSSIFLHPTLYIKPWFKQQVFTVSVPVQYIYMYKKHVRNNNFGSKETSCIAAYINSSL